MVTVTGIYKNGYVKLDKDYLTDNPVKVIVTFLEDVAEIKANNGLGLNDFSFRKSQENLNSFNGSMSEIIIDERRSEA
ncbi:MAG: hypothetical protein JST29_11730 [Bacteroidetes bacterium]|nr:hypothetical protein [Bacteroidota bacterium]MBS1591967.1 hypothetical protein [Bacteroidota bacterium]